MQNKKLMEIDKYVYAVRNVKTTERQAIIDDVKNVIISHKGRPEPNGRTTKTMNEGNGMDPSCSLLLFGENFHITSIQCSYLDSI